jgi:hypothetical protein
LELQLGTLTIIKLSKKVTKTQSKNKTHFEPLLL